MGDDMSRAFLHLVGRTWSNLLAMLGTTTTAVLVFSVVGPFLIFIFYRMVGIHQVKKTGPLGSFKAAVGSLRDRKTLVAPAVTGLIWLCLFSASLVITVYNDHKSLQDALSISMKEAKKQKEEAEVARQVSANADLKNHLRTQTTVSGGQPILETVTVRLIDVFEYTASQIKAVTIQTDTVNTGTAPAYNVVVRQSAETGVGWRFDYKNMNERRREILASSKGTLTTTSVAPAMDLDKSTKGRDFRTFIYGNVSYDDHSSGQSKHHEYTYCYSLFSWDNSAKPDPIGKFVDCEKQPAIRGKNS
jgi:hypothetical protein